MKPVPGSQSSPGSSVILMPPRHVLRNQATRPVTTPPSTAAAIWVVTCGGARVCVTDADRTVVLPGQDYACGPPDQGCPAFAAARPVVIGAGGGVRAGETGQGA